MISLTEFSSNTNSKWPVIFAFSNFFGLVWTGPELLGEIRPFFKTKNYYSILLSLRFCFAYYTESSMHNTTLARKIKFSPGICHCLTQVSLCLTRKLSKTLHSSQQSSKLVRFSLASIFGLLRTHQASPEGKMEL